MEATHKSPEIDKVISKFACGRDRRETVRKRKCMTCGGNAATFRDELSIQEYKISGMCQNCQDKVFGI